MKISRLEWNASARVEMSRLEWKHIDWSGNASAGVEISRPEFRVGICSVARSGCERRGEDWLCQSDLQYDVEVVRDVNRVDYARERQRESECVAQCK